MPGSIHLSVVEWIETPRQGSISTPHFIKVLMGKNTYQSVGREDFTFPVTSIRDNLVIMLCDSEGNLVTKKEVKTISVAEKGDADIVLSLEVGGDFKLRLSFVLNEEEKEKIREMRSYALKRKHTELLKGTNIIISPGTSSQLERKGHSNLSTIKIPKMSTESNLNKVEEHGPLHITKEKDQISFLRVSQSVDDLTGANIKRSVPSRSPSDSIIKMISAFESNAKQNSGSQIIARTRTQVNKIRSQTSMESMSYGNEDIKQRRGSHTMIRRSFSAGDLAGAILQNDPNFEVNMELRETNLLQGSLVGHHIRHKNGGLSRKLFHGTSHYRDWDFSEDMDDTSCTDRTSYYFGIIDMLLPYHLCLTSAPEEVRKFLDNFTATSMHNKKIKWHGVSSHEVKKEIGSRSQSEDPHRKKVGSSNLNGWLIEQGARIFIVIVACGTIIVNTR